MISHVTSSPALVRVAPFAIFLGLTFLQDKFGDTGRYWIYLAKTLAGAGMLAVAWRHIQELEWRFSWQALLVGVGVFALWVELDGHYPPLDAIYAQHICPLLQKFGMASTCAETAIGEPWNPHDAFGPGSILAWFFIVIRIAGSALVVPPLEEVFYRSFVYRYLAAKDFLSVPLNRFLPIPFLVTSLVFAFTHHEWLSALLCGFAYQGLVIWKNRLGDAVTAHAITNLLLGLWVAWRGAWHFW